MPAKEKAGSALKYAGVTPDQDQAPTGEPSGELLRRLLADAAALGGVYGRAVQEHLRVLAKDLAFAAIAIGAAAALGVMAIGVAVATLVLVAAIWLPGWLAALVVLGVMITAMGILLSVGRIRLRRGRASWAARVSEEIRWLQSLFPRRN